MKHSFWLWITNKDSQNTSWNVESNAQMDHCDEPYNQDGPSYCWEKHWICLQGKKCNLGATVIFLWSIWVVLAHRGIVRPLGPWGLQFLKWAWQPKEKPKIHVKMPKRVWTVGSSSPTSRLHWITRFVDHRMFIAKSTPLRHQVCDEGANWSQGNQMKGSIIDIILAVVYGVFL